MSGPLTRLRTQDNARVEDFLNDKLQNSADLGNLNSLLQTAKHQQSLLQQQVLVECLILLRGANTIKLHEANGAHLKASKAAQEHEASMRQQIASFNRQQADIDRRLMIVTRSETSDDAVKLFEVSMEKLRRLDIATGYMEVLKDVDGLM